jgi:hypothetical protein
MAAAPSTQAWQEGYERSRFVAQHFRKSHEATAVSPYRIIMYLQLIEGVLDLIGQQYEVALVCLRKMGLLTIQPPEKMIAEILRGANQR